jgi:hypothetical protein
MKYLKIILPIALGVFFITGLVTNNIRKDAEKYLKTEEMITASGNRQRLSDQEARINFENQRRQAKEDREFKRFLGVNSLEELK